MFLAISALVAMDPAIMLKDFAAMALLEFSTGTSAAMLSAAYAAEPIAPSHPATRFVILCCRLV